MTMYAGLRRMYPNSTAARPHTLGYIVPRSVASDTLFEVWNDSTGSAKRLTLDKDGLLRLLGTRGALAIVDGITAPSAIVGAAILFADSADGDLKVIFGDGTTKTIVTDT